MPSAEFTISSYQVYHISGRLKPVKAIIQLLNSERTARTTLYFVDNEKNLRNTHIIEGSNNSSAYYNLKRFSEVVDILRNEGPLKSTALTRSVTDGFVGIHSDIEFVGEGET